MDSYLRKNDRNGVAPLFSNGGVVMAARTEVPRTVEGWFGFTFRARPCRLGAL